MSYGIILTGKNQYGTWEIVDIYKDKVEAFRQYNEALAVGLKVKMKLIE